MIMFKLAQNKKEMNDVFHVRTEVFVDEQNVPLENEIDEYEDSSTHIIGYDENDQAIATARYRNVDGAAKIERVAVIKALRNQGIGKSLMTFIEDAVKKDGFTQAVLNGQVQAQPFYEALGYQAEGDIFLEENIEHVVMKKSL